MAYQERNIPARASPRAPPPPQPMAAPPPPHYEKLQKKQKTVEQLKRSQVKTAIVLIFFSILLIIIAYISITFHTFEDTKTMDRDSDMFWYSFQVPGLMDKQIPTQIELKSSDYVETNILLKEDYNEDLSIIQLRNLSINDNHEKKTHYIFEEYLGPGKYVIVSYVRDNDNDIKMEYKISRFYVLAFLFPISLLFMVPIILSLIWIMVLQRRKSTAPSDQYAQDHAHRDGHYPGDYGYHESNGPPMDFDGYSAAPPPPRPPRGAQRGAVGAPPIPPGMAPTQQRGRDVGTDYAYASRSGQESMTTTVPCKCGEIIVISDPARPLRIKCPRCGRRGILEGKNASPEDDIFY